MLHQCISSFVIVRIMLIIAFATAFSYQIDSVTDFDIDSDTCQEYVVVNRKGRDIHVLSHNLESSPAHGGNGSTRY